jgi:hypothetical protein
MSAASDALRAVLLATFPTGWAIQFGRWRDDPSDQSRRYIVVRPVGGAGAEVVRRPLFNVAIITGATDASTIADTAAGSIIEALRVWPGSETVMQLQASEPVFMATDDGRTVFELAVSTITD